MTNLHAIDRVDLDFSFEEPVFSSDPELAAWVRSELLVAVDDVLCAHDDGSMLVVDRIELDLGEVEAGQGMTEVVNRLRERLSNALKEARRRKLSYDDAPESENAPEPPPNDDIFWSSSESELLSGHSRLPSLPLRILLEALDAWHDRLNHPTPVSVRFWKQVDAFARNKSEPSFMEVDFDSLSDSIHRFAEHSPPDWDGLLRALPQADASPKDGLSKSDIETVQHSIGESTSTENDTAPYHRTSSLRAIDSHRQPEEDTERDGGTPEILAGQIPTTAPPTPLPEASATLSIFASSPDGPRRIVPAPRAGLQTAKPLGAAETVRDPARIETLFEPTSSEPRHNLAKIVAATSTSDRHFQTSRTSESTSIVSGSDAKQSFANTAHQELKETTLPVQASIADRSSQDAQAQSPSKEMEPANRFAAHLEKIPFAGRELLLESIEHHLELAENKPLFLDQIELAFEGHQLLDMEEFVARSRNTVPVDAPSKDRLESPRSIADATTPTAEGIQAKANPETDKTAIRWQASQTGHQDSNPTLPAQHRANHPAAERTPPGFSIVAPAPPRAHHREESTVARRLTEHLEAMNPEVRQILSESIDTIRGRSRNPDLFTARIVETLDRGELVDLEAILEDTDNPPLELATNSDTQNRPSEPLAQTSAPAPVRPSTASSQASGSYAPPIEVAAGSSNADSVPTLANETRRTADHRLTEQLESMAPEARQILSESIESLRGRSGNPHLFTERVVEALDRGELVDLEDILDRTNRSSSESPTNSDTVEPLTAKATGATHPADRDLAEDRSSSPEKLSSHALALELESSLIENLPETHSQALVCADMVVSLVDKFLPWTESDSTRLLARQILHERLVAGKQPYAHREVAQALVLGFAKRHPSIDRNNLAAMVQRRLILPPFATPRPTLQPTTAAPKSVTPVASIDLSDGLSVLRAGIVIASPYVPRLFTMLGLVQEGRFVDDESVGRAMRLLRYTASGTDLEPDDFNLERVLCGIAPDAPVPESGRLTDRDRETVDQMVQAIVQNWSALGKTSVAGLRETFLNRPGWLQKGDDFWQLRVQKGTFDMLLDKLPWGISMIKHPWMELPMQVEWR